MYIYKIKNKINNKVYIGSSFNYERRWNQHLKLLSTNNHTNIYLQEDFNTHGKESFEFSLLFTFETKPSRLTLLKKEKYFLDQFSKRLVYNIDLKILKIPSKSLSVKNNKYKPKKSLVSVILSYSKFEEDYLKTISVDYKIPIIVVKNTVDKLISSGKLHLLDGIYYRKKTLS